MKRISAWLDGITMYRLLLYYLIGLLGVAVVLSLVGVLHVGAVQIIMSSAYLTAICWVSNKIFGYVFEAPTNPESPLITALILALIITPATSAQGLVFLTAAAGLAIASKYLIAVNYRHIFNPAAIAVVLTSYGAGDSASWWVGTAWMLPFVLLGGILIINRIRRWPMVLTFVAVAMLATGLLAISAGPAATFSTLQKEVLSSALFFAAFVMLTEPLTSLTTKANRLIYAGITGLLFAPQVQLFGIFATPELALSIGNLFAFAVGPRAKTFVSLARRIKLSPDSADFIWKPERPFAYQPGQYMEFTLQHTKTDARGARRYFTLASSPTEKELRLGVKFYPNGSSFKKALLGLQAGDEVMAAALGGDFVLPKNPNQKIVFIAGGIGITPYRAMLKYLVDTNQKRDIALLYAAKTSDDIVYRDVIDAARQQLGLKTVFATDGMRLTPELIAREVPDLKDRLFYISGPHGMVVAMEENLAMLGVPRSHIKKDFFSGYA